MSSNPWLIAATVTAIVGLGSALYYWKKSTIPTRQSPVIVEQVNDQILKQMEQVTEIVQKQEEKKQQQLEQEISTFQLVLFDERENRMSLKLVAKDHELELIPFEENENNTYFTLDPTNGYIIHNKLALEMKEGNIHLAKKKSTEDKTSCQKWSIKIVEQSGMGTLHTIHCIRNIKLALSAKQKDNTWKLILSAPNKSSSGTLFKWIFHYMSPQ